MSRVSLEELTELQDPDTWEDDEDPIRPAVKSPRAIVSVAFAREDFENVADFAEQNGMKISEFIRRAALERISPNGRAAVESVTGGVQTSYATISPHRPRIEVKTPPREILTTT